MSAQQNSRQHPRYDIRISADVVIDNQSFSCVTSNLSAGGVGVICDRELAAGAVANLTLFVVVDDIEDLGTDPLDVQATVVWCKPGGPETFNAGFKFNPMSREKSAYLGRFLAAVSPPK